MPIIQAVDSTGMQLSFLKLGASPLFQELIYKCHARCYVSAHLIPDYHNSVIADAVDEGQEQDPAWEDYFQEIEEFGMYMLNTLIERRGGLPPLFPSRRKKFKQTTFLSGLIGRGTVLLWTSSNVWTIQQAFVKRMLRPEGFF